jgi:hypothetical protein
MTQALESRTIFQFFLILPDEIIDNQMENVAITKNCWQPETQSIPGSGALQVCVKS